MNKIFKKGDRILYKKGTKYECKGTIICMGTDEVPKDWGYVYALWDDSEVKQYAQIENVELELVDENKDLTEDKAVMLLRSIGYTVSKGK